MPDDAAESDPSFDAAGFEALFAKLAGPLRLFARRWLPAASAEDATQEAFVRLLGQDDPPDDPAAWLFTCVRNLATDAARRRAVREQVVPPPDASDVEGDPLEIEQAVVALSALTDQQRGLIVARLWGGLGYQAAADLVGCSVSTAHTDYHAALATLRPLVEGTNKNDPQTHKAPR